MKVLVFVYTFRLGSLGIDARMYDDVRKSINITTNRRSIHDTQELLFKVSLNT